MITKRFDYTALNRTEVNGQRVYQCPNNQNLPSVTTILDKTKTEKERNALEQWKKRVGIVKAEQIKNEAAARGTRMHRFLENYVSTDTLSPSGSHPCSIQARKMANVIIDSGLSKLGAIYGSEVALWYPLLYAGTTDLVAEWKGELTIVDFKNSIHLKSEDRVISYYCQCCAYILAFNELYKQEIKQAIIMIATTEYEYQEFIIDASNFENYSNMWWDRASQFYDL
jgi:genome maintenance exonuclease 1